MSEVGGPDAMVEYERELIAAARREAAELARAGSHTSAPLDTVAGYTLLREIGRGGMGIVYEAEQEHPRRAVALKVIKGEARGEVQIQAHLRHPGIAAIYEAGRTKSGHNFFTMELVRGVPLAEYARLRQLPFRDQLQLFCRLCEAVHYAHQRGVIHSDLKPSNILVDVDGNPKILDFGLARIRDTDGTIRVASFEGSRGGGTLPYMSPEQVRVRPDEALDVRCDVYALGVILYELTTGCLPYDVSMDMPREEAVRIICEQSPCPPGAVNRAVRGDLELIVLKALAKEPSRRYDGAAALAEDIARYLAHLPIRARPASVAYVLRKWVSRRRSAVVLLAITGALLVAFAVLLQAQSDQIARAHEEIEELRQPSGRAQRNMQGATLLRVADRLQGLGEALIEQGQFATAEMVLGECQSIRRSTLEELNPLTAYTESIRGECLTKLGRFEEAEPLLLMSYPIILDSRAEGDEQTQCALKRIVDLYEAWGKPAEEAEWRGKLSASVSRATRTPATMPGE